MEGEVVNVVDNLHPAQGFDDVFSNSLVWRTLGQCLNFGDLKAIRLACSNFNQKIITETNFKKRACVNLKADQLQKNAFGNTTILWKHFKILLFSLENESFEENRLSVQDVMEMDWLYPLLESAESIVLYAHAKNVYAPPQQHYPSLMKILEAPVSLKKLGLDVNILDREENSQLFSNLSDKARLTLENLVEFHILSSGFRSLSQDSDSSFVDSTGMLAALMNNLQVVQVDDIVDEGMGGFPDTVDDQLHMQVQNVLGIVEQNKNKITKLKLDDMVLWFTSTSFYLQSLSTKVFPSLTSTLIRISQSEVKHLIEFFKKQPLLEELDLTTLSQFPNELLALIREKGKNLRRLRIKTKGFEKPEQDMWNFLHNLKYLEDIQLDFRFSNRFSQNIESPNSVFINLPPSIKKISLIGFPYVESEYLTAPLFVNINPNIVTKLSIKKCQDAVNDETLEFICRHLKMLQCLEISEAVNCSDYGFTGIDPKSESKESDFTLRDLKGLKTLMIRKCSKITNATCAVIAFQELVYLDISDNELITEDGIKIILQNPNPSLERLKTSELTDDFPMEKEISKTHPRFQENGHVFSDGGGSDDGDDSMVHFPDGSSNISGPHDFEELDYDDDYDDHDFSDDEFDEDLDYEY